MSTFRPLSVICPACQAPQSVTAPESANVQRQAHWREQVLAGTFMRFVCTRCCTPFVVERELLYTDLEAGLFIGVFPQERRGEHEACAHIVEEACARAIGEAPAVVRAAHAHVRPRVCFGYAELREKVVCAEAGLDDRVVSALALLLLGGIQGARDAGVTGLVLVEVEEDGALLFAPRLEPSDPDAAALLRVARASYEDLARDRERIARLLPRLFAGAYVSARQYA